MNAEPDIFTPTDYTRLRRAAARILEMWGAGRHLFDVEELVHEAWVYRRKAQLAGKTFIAYKLLWCKMLEYVTARVYDGMPNRDHWTYQLAWAEYRAPAALDPNLRYLEDMEFLQWLAAGLSRWEAQVVWARLRDDGADKRWGRIAQRLNSTEAAVKLAYSHGVHKLRRRMVGSLERN